MSAFRDQIAGLENLLPYFEQEVIPQNIDNKDQLIQWLAVELEHLSSNDFARFLQLLYRIDIEEKKVKIIIDREESPFLKLADLIFERELQKKYWREKFKSASDDDDENEKWD